MSLTSNEYTINYVNGEVTYKVDASLSASFDRHGSLLVAFDLDDIFEYQQDILVYLMPKGVTIPDNVYEKKYAFSVYGNWKNDFANIIKTPEALNIDEHDVGRDSYARKVCVFDIPKAINLRAGLTIHDGYGTWSSWPTHEFEARALASPANTFPNFSEVFAFVTDPVGGWGLQTLVGKNGTQIRAVADREIVTIPISLHPVVGAPDVRMAYFWAYTNGGEKFTKEGRV